MTTTPRRAATPSPAAPRPRQTGRRAAPARNQEQRSAEMVERLLAATIACLTRDGYAATSVGEIAHEAGVSRGALQHHFDTKADLLFGVFESFSAALVQALAGVPAQGGLEERVAAAVRSLWSMFSAPRYVAMLEILVGSRSEPALWRRVRRRRDADNVAMVAEMTRLFADCDLADRDLGEALAFGTATLRGLALYRHFVDDPAFYEGAIAMLTDTLTRRLRGTAA